MIPISRIEEASSSSDSLSNEVRGWSGFGEMFLMLISLIDDDAVACRSSIDISESSPRPSAFRFIY